MGTDEYSAHLWRSSEHAICDENSPLGYGLASYVGSSWERAYHDAVPTDMRKVILRTSFVLGRTGGAMSKLKTIARSGFGGKFGTGRQGMSWIHEGDLCRIFEQAIVDDSMQGVYVATSPNPVSNSEFMRTLRKALKMPIGLPNPAWLIRIGTKLLKTDPELALYGRYCRSKRLSTKRFEFMYGELKDAMTDLFSKRNVR